MLDGILSLNNIFNEVTSVRFGSFRLFQSLIERMAFFGMIDSFGSDP